jgi:hypothetical protein
MSDDLEIYFPELNPANAGIVPVPPQEMRFTELKVEPVLDGGPVRLRVYVEVTAFQQRPNMEIALNDADGDEIVSASIIEPMQRRNVFTMHVRGSQQSGKFSLHARLFYPDQPDSDTRQIEFEIQPG